MKKRKIITAFILLCFFGVFLGIATEFLRLTLGFSQWWAGYIDGISLPFMLLLIGWLVIEEKAAKKEKE